VSFDNEYRYFEDHGVAGIGFDATFLQDTTATGHRKTYATIGCALLWAPFYAAGDAAARALHAGGWPVAVDGYSAPYVASVCYGSAVYGFLALLLSAHMARRLAGPSTAAVLAVWMGTPLLFYMYVAPVFAHACGAFAAALFLWTWLRVRERWTVPATAFLGAAGALVVMVREQDAVFLVVPALDLAYCLIRRAAAQDSAAPRITAGRAAAAAAAAALGFALAYLPQAFSYLVINGGLRPSSDVSRKMTWTAPHAWEVVFSTAHGWIFWTPLVLLSAAGLVWLWTSAEPARRWLVTCLLVAAGLTVYVAGSVESWTVAGAFGQRRFTSLTPVVVIGLAALFRAARPVLARAAITLLVVLSVWWNLGLMIQFGEKSMDRQRLALASNAYRTFVVLPREAPRVAWQYLTNRASFYNR
jgi:hypothetical protein